MPSALVAARSLVNSTAHDPKLTAAERVRALRRLRARYPELVGHVDTYIGAAELQREAGALQRAEQFRAAREDADVREEALRQGLTPEEADAAGLRSHADLDALAGEGTLGEILAQEARVA